MSNVLQLNVGEKISSSLNITAIPKGCFTASSILISDNTFLIALQSNWSPKEIREFNREVQIDVAEIDNVLIFVFSFGNDEFVTDVPFNPSHRDKETCNYIPCTKEGDSVVFNIVLLSEDTTILAMRLTAPSTNESNIIISSLIEGDKRGYNNIVFQNKVDKIYAEMSPIDIRNNSFLTIKDFKKI